MSTVSEHPTRRLHRGGRMQATVDASARTVVARKATIADIAAEAGRSAASFYNHYDSKEATVRGWALPPDDQTCIDTLANIFHRAAYYEEVRPT